MQKKGIIYVAFIIILILISSQYIKYGKNITYGNDIELH